MNMLHITSFAVLFGISLRRPGAKLITMLTSAPAAP